MFHLIANGVLNCKVALFIPTTVPDKSSIQVIGRDLLVTVSVPPYDFFSSPWRNNWSYALHSWISPANGLPLSRRAFQGSAPAACWASLFSGAPIETLLILETQINQ